MRIGFDCSALSPTYLGGGNSFVEGLADGFVRAKGSHSLQFYVTDENAALLESYKGLSGVSVIVIPKQARHFFLSAPTTTLLAMIRNLALKLKNRRVYQLANDVLWSGARKLIQRHSDVIYFPSTVMPVFSLRMKTYLSLHDIQHVHFPEFFNEAELHHREVLYKLSVKSAGYVQASTEYMKEDFLRFFSGLRKEQVFVIPEGVDLARFSNPGECASSTDRFGLPADFLFLPAQLWHHKNHLTLLRALKRLEVDEGLKIPLVLTGGRYSAADSVLGFITENNMDYVRYLGVVSAEEIVELYHRASMLVMPTLFESSSLPVLEAIAAGKPVLASNIPALLEMGRHFQINFFDPTNVEELAGRLLSLWNNLRDLNQQVMNNRTVIAAFSWERIAVRYIQFFETTAG